MNRQPRHATSGYVLLSVLLMGSLIVLTAGTFSRHILAAFRQSTASRWVQGTHEAAVSGLAFARELGAAGLSAYDGTVAAGDHAIALTLVDAGAGRRTIRVDATTAGMGTTLVADASVIGAVGDELPRLTASAAALAHGDPAQVKLAGTQTLADVVIQGTLVLARGSRITLRNVIVRGVVVSEPALVGPPYAALEATTLDLDGSVRIDGGLLLPGCGILMPDGTLTVRSTSRVEVHGVVLAHHATWLGGGSADDHIVAAQPVALPAGLDRPGWGRTPPPWPESLAMQSWVLATLAFPRTDATGPEAASIKGYAFTGN